MIPKNGDKIYLIIGNEVNIFEVISADKLHYYSGPSYIKFRFNKLIGNWPLNWFVVEEEKLSPDSNMVKVYDDTYLIFDEQIFINHLENVAKNW